MGSYIGHSAATIVSATYTKLRDGDWGMRVVVSGGGAVQPEDVVLVHTKSGKTREETVAGVLWQGADRDDPSNTVFLCQILKPATVNNGR